MSIFRRIMLGGGLDVDALPETHKLYYTSNNIIPINGNPFAAPIIKHIYDSNTGNGVIICVKEIKRIYGGGVFKNNKDITHITIPDSVIEIGQESFSGCENLRSINIPDKVSSLEYRMLYGCKNLENLTIGKGITWSAIESLKLCAQNVEGSVTVNFNIPDREYNDFDYFYGSRFDKAVIGESVTSIGKYAFYNTYSVKCLIIGKGVMSIGSYAFDGCTSLREIYCKATTPPSLGSGVFLNNNSGRKFYVPMESVDAYKSAENWSVYADVIEGYEF